MSTPLIPSTGSSPPQKEVTYRKFTWVGNQITDDDMTKLYQIMGIVGGCLTVVGGIIAAFTFKRGIAGLNPFDQIFGISAIACLLGLVMVIFFVRKWWTTEV